MKHPNETTVAVVGGGSGIGRACVDRLGSSCRVVVLDRRLPTDLPASVVHQAQMDARDTDGVAAAFADAEAAVGPLNGVVYAAGVAFVTPFLDIDDDEWNLVNDVTLSGTQRVLATFARLRVDRNEPGAFVAISSVDAQRPVAGLAHYCAAKAGVESLVRVAALELATHQIRVNAVAPGATMTPPIEAMLARAPAIREDFLEHIPMGRIACPSEIASVVEFLLSDAARYVTGQTVIVDGGMTLREHARLLDPVAETS